MATKIDKKELNEPDKLQLFFLVCREFVEKNKIRIYTGTGIFILVLLVVSSWYLYQFNYETNAGKLYLKTFESTMKPGTPAPEASLIKGYKDLIAQYPRSSSAVMANFRLGNLYRGRHEVDPAINAYQEFLDRVPKDGDLVTLAYSGLGSCYESKKELVKALEFYEKAMTTNTAVPFEAFNYGNIARVYESMNNSSKAAEFYRKALEKTTDPLMTLYLKRKISFLGG
jgi:tetratricopeptide (TPR) repeat protein